MRAWAVPAAAALCWAWPSALIVPAVTAVDTSATRLASAGIVCVVGAVIATAITILRGRASGWITGIGVTVAIVAVPCYLALVDLGVLGGLGGDRGQALDIALMRLTDGVPPYDALTYDGGRITPMPPGLLMAAPAHFLTGSSGYMTVYLVPIALWLLWRLGPHVAAAGAIAIVAAPAFWADALSDGDLVTTTILGIAVAANALRVNSNAAALAWGLALGVACGSRVTSLLIAVLAIAMVARRSMPLGARMGIGALLPTIVLTVPIWAWDPASFSPLHTTSFARGPLGLVLSVAVAVTAVAAAYATAMAGQAWRPLLWLSGLSAIALTAVPLIVSPSSLTLFTTGYAVAAILVPATLATPHRRRLPADPAVASPS